MSQKNKALQTAATGIAILAVSMVGYYWVSGRMHKSDNDLSMSEKADAPAAPAEEKAPIDMAGVYSASDSVEGLGHRLAFFTVTHRPESGGFTATAKVDPIGSETEAPTFFACAEVTIGDKEFFLKCSDATLGQISFTGEWAKANGGLQVPGKLFWTKDTTEVASKAITLARAVAP